MLRLLQSVRVCVPLFATPRVILPQTNLQLFNWQERLFSEKIRKLKEKKLKEKGKYKLKSHSGFKHRFRVVPLCMTNRLELFHLEDSNTNHQVIVT